VRVGLHALGIGTGARREVIDAVARAAEATGFATLWAGEHVVMVDQPSSRYPYAPDGRLPIATDADWLDPLIGLSFAAAATVHITVATGILLLPEHNPVLVAKQAATLDTLSHGRLTLGVGIGWSADEFAALGIPFAHRASRTIEYLAAMRALWRDDRASFDGEFVRFREVRSYPKPVRGRRIPIVLGGNSPAALARAATHADGWYGFGLAGTAAVREHVTILREHCHRRGRDPKNLQIAVAIDDCQPDDLPELAELGVTELVLVGQPPAEPGAATAWVRDLAHRWRPAIGERG
jgi:probable F420-dependent oxidoreductase